MPVLYRQLQAIACTHDTPPHANAQEKVSHIKGNDFNRSCMRLGNSRLRNLKTETDAKNYLCLKKVSFRNALLYAYYTENRSRKIPEQNSLPSLAVRHS